MRTIYIIVLLILPLTIWGQEERKYIREGYKAYMDEDFNKAEIDFRKAENANYESYIARYNTNTALYQQKKLEESAKGFESLLGEVNDPLEQSKLSYNIGNTLMDGQQYKQAVEAYKRSLKLNPDDEDARYNLAYALEKLREEQEQEQQQQQNDQNQDQENSEDQNSDEDQKDQQDKQQDQDKQDDKQSDEQEEQQKEEQQKQEMSQEEAERLLNAILQKEKDVKEKVDKKKASAAKIKTDKDW